MLTKTIEIDGKKFALGESTAGAIEDYQDAMAVATGDRDRVLASRRFICHCLERGGQPTTMEELRNLVSLTGQVTLDEEAIAVSQARRVAKGEVAGP